MVCLFSMTPCSWLTSVSSTHSMDTSCVRGTFGCICIKTLIRASFEHHLMIRLMPIGYIYIYTQSLCSMYVCIVVCITLFNLTSIRQVSALSSIHYSYETRRRNAHIHAHLHAAICTHTCSHMHTYTR